MSTNERIQERVMNPEAIEAAAKAIHHYDIDKLLTTFPVPTKHHRAEAEAALEAAAPYLIREARAAELEAAAEHIGLNHIGRALCARAAAIRAGGK